MNAHIQLVYFKFSQVSVDRLYTSPGRGYEDLQSVLYTKNLYASELVQY